MQKKLVVYLLSYKRIDLIEETIKSILTQDDISFDLIISENSPDNTVYEKIYPYCLKHSFVKIIKRRPSLSSVEHFKAIMTECQNYEYAMLFHDDDTLNKKALSTMLSSIEKHPEASAVACNAFIIDDKTYSTQLLSPNIKKTLYITTASQLILRYLFRFLSHPPFPSYIYRTQFIKDLSLSTEDGGKYSDTSFLVKLVKRGPFIWLHEPLVNYRRHLQNDSAEINMNDIFKISVFFFKTSPHLIVLIIFYYLKQVLKKQLLEFKP